MLEKKDIKCIEKLVTGPFWESYLILIESESKSKGIFEMRVMKKKTIIKYDEQNLLKHEHKMRTKIRNVFIVNKVTSFQDYDYLYLITEHASINLLELLRTHTTFSAKMTRFYISEIISAVQYLHSKNLYFGLLSPANMQVADDGHIKLRYDFLNYIDEDKNMLNRYIEYTSLDHILYGELTKCSDYWSIGVILYQMLAGYTPFGTMNVQDAISNMKSCNIEFPSHINNDAKDLIKRFLIVNPTKRLGFHPQDVQAIRNHEFLREINWFMLEQKLVQPPFLFDVTERIRNRKPVDLDLMYTTDFLPFQKDGYGTTFLFYGFGVSKPENSFNIK